MKQKTTTATLRKMSAEWTGSAWQNESTLHQLSPYIGKTKSSMAASLVRAFTQKGHVVYDPFCGCGTFALEAWSAGRQVLANDLSPYASLVTKAKLFPYSTLKAALADVQTFKRDVDRAQARVDLRTVPSWVREFFHPDTLCEIVAWSQLLRTNDKAFLMACLLGILHHQRPGFLSFPSSHTVPYLRTKRFPQKSYASMYEYRPVLDRLIAKVTRAFRRVPSLDFDIKRNCFSADAASLIPQASVDAILTSPPYMRQLDYGRDNRLRLWFLGCRDWRDLDSLVSPSEAEFLDLMEKAFATWKNILSKDAYCIVVVGDGCSRLDRHELPQAVSRIATKVVGGYALESQVADAIPNERRVRRGIVGSASETIIVLKRDSSSSVAAA